MSLTNLQRQIITTSFAQLIPISDKAAAVFYQRLWEIAPETEAMFANTDMAQQGVKLMQTLGVTVRALYDTNAIVPLMSDLGKRHIGYGVTKEQYALIGDALMWMIEYCLKEDFTPEVRAAWLDGYELIASIAISAYD